MAQYIRSTLQALASGDIHRSDACYSLSAHLISAFVSPSQKTTSEQEVQTFLKQVVDRVADGILSEQRGTAYVIMLKERLFAGEQFADIIANVPLIEFR